MGHQYTYIVTNIDDLRGAPAESIEIKLWRLIFESSEKILAPKRGDVQLFRRSAGPVRIGAGRVPVEHSSIQLVVRRIA